MNDKESDNNLQRRVSLFNALALPGQPKTMHIGTWYLVNDLWEEVQRLQRIVETGRRGEEMTRSDKP